MKFKEAKPMITKEQFEVISAKRLQNVVIINYYDKQEKRHKTIEDKDNIPHEDLVNAFSLLKEHVIKIYKYSGSEDNIQITGFSLKKDNDDNIKTFVVKATMKFDSGKVASINTPSINAVVDGEPGIYGFEDGMKSCLEKCIDELYLYTFEGKKVPDNQLEMPFEEEKEEDSND